MLHITPFRDSAPAHILIATFYFSLMQIAVKWLSNIPAYEVVFFRAFVSLIICYFWLKLKKIPPWGTHKKDLIIRGLSGTIALSIFFYTLQNMPLATAVTIQYLSPIFTIILAIWINNEKASKIHYLLFFIAFIGVAMIRGASFNISIELFILAIIGSFFSGVAYNYIRKLKGRENPLVVVFYFPLVVLPTVGTYTAFNWVMPQGIEWLILIMIGVFTQLAQVTLTRGIQLDRAENSLSFYYFGVIFALLWGWGLFNEAPTTLGILGMIIISVSALLTQKFKKSPS